MIYFFNFNILKILLLFFFLFFGFGSPETEVLVFRLKSEAPVHNLPSGKTIFKIEKPTLLTKVFTYHWNDGKGSIPGSIGIKRLETGETIGTWDALGTFHMFDAAPGSVWPQKGDGPPYLYWTIRPMVHLSEGNYEIIDSDSDTWSTNREMEEMGCAWIYGISKGHF